MNPEVGGQGVRRQLKNQKNIGFLSNTGPDPLKNHKLPSPGPMQAKRDLIEMAMRWLSDDGPLIVVYDSSMPSSTKKKEKKRQSFGSLLQNVLDPHM